MMEGSPTELYGSDVAVDLLNSLGIPFIAFNPGASFRGLHDSLLNYRSGQAPEIVECLHEEISVAAAHGYAKASGRPMAVALHDIVGLQHGSMAVFNAWCDRVPMLILGGTGPMDTARRRPWIDWIHTALVQGNLVRDFVKWDDQPYSVDNLVDSLLRAYRLSVTEPAGPVYICLDAALQEDPLEDAKALPDPAKFAPGWAPAADPHALQLLAAALKKARWPVIVADYTGRSEEGFASLARLAERWAMPVLDRGGRLNLPTDHPMNLTGAERTVLERADVILGLDVADLHGALSSVDRTTRVTQSLVPSQARVFAIGLQDYGVRSLSSDFQKLYPVEMSLLSDTRLALPALIEELGDPTLVEAHADITARRQEVERWHRDLRSSWLEEARRSRNESPLATGALAYELWGLLRNKDFVVANGDLRGWVQRIFGLARPRQHLGDSGGAGLGYGMGATIGACLAHRNSGRIVLNIQSDGDLMFTPGGLWSLAHYRLPALIVMFNNRSFYNSEEHQMNMARHRRHDLSRAGIGTRLDDPFIDFAALAESMGVVGIGPVDNVETLSGALQEALGVVEEQRRPVLVDVLTQAR